jgi:glucose-6-phosphate dehydrogenase assembly protein OpcA
VEAPVIIDLPDTNVSKISRALVSVREEGGAVALGRVLTLVIVVSHDTAEEVIEAANDASREHPMRVIVVMFEDADAPPRLDAEIRVGGDAGASEVVVARLYGALVDHGRSVVTPLMLPDSPVVAWWPKDAPAHVADDAIGSMAQRRITDAAEAKAPRAALKNRAKTYTPGDTDLAWTRVTLWRGLLAAALDQPPFEPVVEATVVGASDSPSTDLLAAWLAGTLRCPVRRARTSPGLGMVSVRLERRSGPIDLVRPDGATATLSQAGQPERRISLARRATAECLAEELRRLDPDDIYEEAIRKGLVRFDAKGPTASEAIREGEAPSPAKARRDARRIARQSRRASSSDMVTASDVPPAPEDETVVKEAAARKLADVTQDPAPAATSTPGKPRKRAARAPTPEPAS